MKPSLLVLSFLFAVVPASCGALGGNTPTVDTPPVSVPSIEAPSVSTPTVDIGSLLGGITDQPSAEAAKAPLESAVPQLQTALDAANAKGKLDQAAGTTDAAGVSSMLDGVLAKFGLGAGTVDQIGALLQNEQVKSVLGPTLEQLKGLLSVGS